MNVIRYYGAKKDTDETIERARDKAGWNIYQEYDPSVLASMATLFTSFNLSTEYKFSDVYAQNGYSCTANALCAAYKLLLKKQNFLMFNPSCQFLYYNTRKYEGTAPEVEGAQLGNAVVAFNCIGVCDEEEYYEPPGEECYKAATGNNLCKYHRLEQKINHFKACLINDKCPFVFGFVVYKNFKRNFRGVYSMPMPMPMGDEPARGHAVMATGFDDKYQCIIALNSWGRDWGDQGYFYVPYRLIENPNICFDFWKIDYACRSGQPGPSNPTPCPRPGKKEQ